MIYDIDTIGGLIERFGGPSSLGRQLGVTQEAVSMWRIRGSIPTGWHMRLAARAAREGLRVNPSVWGLDEDDVRGLCPSAHTAAHTAA